MEREINDLRILRCDTTRFNKISILQKIQGGKIEMRAFGDRGMVVHNFICVFYMLQTSRPGAAPWACMSAFGTKGSENPVSLENIFQGIIPVTANYQLPIRNADKM